MSSNPINDPFGTGDIEYDIWFQSMNDIRLTAGRDILLEATRDIIAGAGGAITVSGAGDTLVQSTGGSGSFVGKTAAFLRANTGSAFVQANGGALTLSALSTATLSAFTGVTLTASSGDISFEDQNYGPLLLKRLIERPVMFDMLRCANVTTAWVQAFAIDTNFHFAAVTVTNMALPEAGKVLYAVVRPDSDVAGAIAYTVQISINGGAYTASSASATRAHPAAYICPFATPLALALDDTYEVQVKASIAGGPEVSVVLWGFFDP